MGENKFGCIYKIVKRIPIGKVATYGQIARIADRLEFKAYSERITPRLVGRVLHKNPDPTKIPCHRVVNCQGKLAENYAFGGWREQKKKLLKEGVEFKNKMCVDLRSNLWKTN